MPMTRYPCNFSVERVSLIKTDLDDKTITNFEDDIGLDHIAEAPDFDIFRLNNFAFSKIEPTDIYGQYQCKFRPKVEKPRWYYSLIVDLRFTYHFKNMSRSEAEKFMSDCDNELESYIRESLMTGVLRQIEDTVRVMINFIEPKVIE